MLTAVTCACQVVQLKEQLLGKEAPQLAAAMLSLVQVRSSSLSSYHLGAESEARMHWRDVLLAQFHRTRLSHLHATAGAAQALVGRLGTDALCHVKLRLPLLQASLRIL